MLKLSIDHEAASTDDLIEALDRVRYLIGQGITRNLDAPRFDITGLPLAEDLRLEWLTALHEAEAGPTKPAVSHSTDLNESDQEFDRGWFWTLNDDDWHGPFEHEEDAYRDAIQALNPTPKAATIIWYCDWSDFYLFYIEGKLRKAGYLEDLQEEELDRYIARWKNKRPNAIERHCDILNLLKGEGITDDGLTANDIAKLLRQNPELLAKYATDAANTTKGTP